MSSSREVQALSEEISVIWLLLKSRNVINLNEINTSLRSLILLFARLSSSIDVLLLSGEISSILLSERSTVVSAERLSSADIS